MRELLCWLTILGFGPAVFAAPVLVVSETEVSLGDVVRGEVRTTAFVLENAGDAPLEIGDIATGCACTVADVDRSIAPGESGTLRVEVDTTTLRGDVGRVLQLTTNDPANPRPKLVVRMNVLTSVDLFPGDKIVVGNSRGLKPVQEILVRKSSEETEPLRVDRLRTKHPDIDLDARRLTERTVFPHLGDGREGDWLLTVSLRPDAEPGSRNDVVTFETGLVHEPEIALALKTVVARSVVLGKERLRLARGASKEQSIVANVRRGLDPTELEVKSPHPGLTVEASPLGGRAWSITLSAGPAASLPAGSYTVELRVGRSTTSLIVDVVDG